MMLLCAIFNCATVRPYRINGRDGWIESSYECKKHFITLQHTTTLVFYKVPCRTCQCFQRSLTLPDVITTLTLSWTLSTSQSCFWNDMNVGRARTLRSSGATENIQLLKLSDLKVNKWLLFGLLFVSRLSDHFHGCNFHFKNTPQ